MILSHYRAGSGAVLVETREEQRLLRELLGELPKGAMVGTMAAPSGQVKDARTGKAVEDAGLANAYAWASDGPGRVLVVHDWHVLANNPGHWRMLIDRLPGLRSPRSAVEGDSPSLVVFVEQRCGELQHVNPLRGAVPELEFKPPGREAFRGIAERLCPLKAGADAELVVDALCGLAADSHEQAAAECLAARFDGFAEYLRSARCELIREAGLEIWPATARSWGSVGVREFVEAELLPWVHDEQLSVRRILSAGLPGTGKSFFAVAGQALEVRVLSLIAARVEGGDRGK